MNLTCSITNSLIYLQFLSIISLTTSYLLVTVTYYFYNSSKFLGTKKKFTTLINQKNVFDI